MLVRDYEKAKSYASTYTDEWLFARRKRHDRIGTYFALAGLAGFALMFGGSAAFARFAPGFEPAFPGTYRLLTTLLPALCIAGFLVSSQLLDRRRGIIDLARRLKGETQKKEK